MEQENLKLKYNKYGVAWYKGCTVAICAIGWLVSLQDWYEPKLGTHDYRFISQLSEKDCIDYIDKIAEKYGYDSRHCHASGEK